MRHLLLLASIVACACSTGPTSPTGAALGEEFTLRPGAAATIEGTGLTIRFQAVASDSRCPADVICIHPGEAVVALGAVFTGGGLSWEASTAAASDVVVGGYLVRLVRLEPYPYSSTRIGPGDYRATLLVTPR
jgi:hypothetical protein